MNRNRLLIITSPAVAILGVFLPWASVSVGFFGAMSVRDTQGDSTSTAVFGVTVIVLAHLQDNKITLPRNSATGASVIGALQTPTILINLLNPSRVSGSQGAVLKSYGVSVHVGIGFLSDLLAGIATAIFGAMVPPGSKLSEDTLIEVTDASKNLSKTVAQAITAVVKSASEGINKQSEKLKEAKEVKAAEVAQAESAAMGMAALPESMTSASEEPAVPVAENGTREPSVGDSTSGNSAF